MKTSTIILAVLVAALFVALIRMSIAWVEERETMAQAYDRFVHDIRVRCSNLQQEHIELANIWHDGLEDNIRTYKHIDSLQKALADCRATHKPMRLHISFEPSARDTGIIWMHPILSDSAFRRPLTVPCK